MVLSIYILELQENKWYIGKTYKKVKERFQEHLDGKGSSWTSKYKPIKIHHTIDTCGHVKGAEYWQENALTLEYMEEYGIENVRGGSYTNVVLYPEQLRYLDLVTNPDNFFEGKLNCYIDDDTKELYKAYKNMEQDEKYNCCYKCFSKTHFAKDCDLGRI
jgi:predicted GIY-YIG superfamily endonuclease